ncbi:MAG: arsenate reductase family protein [Crocinitomicaceae bacterium]
MSDKYIVYHNPRCSKSRMAVDYLIQAGKEIDIIEYLKEAPSKEELIAVLDKLNVSAESIVRKGEADYKQNFKGDHMSENQWVDAMVEFPKLIERPIVIKKNKAVVATDRIN